MGTAFLELGIMPEISKAVEEMDWLLPTDIQGESIPLILGGGDVLMAAETGSGKTGAFCMPVIQIVSETIKDIQEGKGGKAKMTFKSDTTKWRMNVYDRGSSLAMDKEGLLCQSRDHHSWHGTRSNKGVRGKGKYYYEATVTDEGLCRVGWATPKADLSLGTDKQGFGYGGTGKKSFGRQFDDYGGAYGINDVLGCYLDLDNSTIKYTKNGTDLGTAFDIPGHIRDSVFLAAVVLKNAEMKFNFGDTKFKFPPSGGFIGLSEAPASVVSPVVGGGQAVVESKPAPNAPKAIIIEPSRELAEQTLTQITKFKKYLQDPQVRELLVIGGQAAKDQVQALSSGVDIVVATPGRLEDLISTGKILLSQVRFFILDEADGLLTQGYSELITRLWEQIPKITADGKRLQMIVCSATLHSFEVKKLAEKLMHFPIWVDLKGQDSVPDTVHHVVVKVDPKQDTLWHRQLNNAKFSTDGVHYNDNIRASNMNHKETLSEAVKMLKPEYVVTAIKHHRMDQAIIFCRTKLDCDNLEQYFVTMGGGPRAHRHQFSCVCLHGDRKPNERRQNLQNFKDKKVRFLICTDVAARGIDVRGIPYVINVTMPDEKSNYVHRIGRVGRADRMGLAISLVSVVPEKVWYHGCPSRGKSCYNTQLTEYGGCCIWYNEMQLLADIEDHLGVTIGQCEPDMKVEADEFDGKVTYGAKRKMTGGLYKGHADILAPTVKELAELERNVQTSFLHLSCKKDTLFGL
ncbi:ATP-dependent RNA helicase DDX1-like [Ptychodera flava]|uniref:ATP-dependent RNA helicase DDX1-like n=1 Tax=Ptychodera flava TaxID=63121 RepID=UPI00396A5B56